MNSNAQNFAMGSYTGEHPEEMNAQTGAQNAQTGARRASQRSARTGSHPLLPSSIVNESIINGMELHDYGFMGSWSTSGSFHINNPTNFYNSSGKSNGSTVGIPSKPIPNPQMGHSGEPQLFENGGNNDILTNTFDIPIQPQITRNGLTPYNTNAHGGQIGLSQVQYQITLPYHVLTHAMFQYNLD
ncbi:hypothetical protein F0562_012353 [Nyssa sinensis]|uniref:Uncharacterized protein n=1 Tax=Nyssa sinensis TaxID=561372 RepID=A0A5J4ZX85_9ASTE|nr:hypothetical protein F0562_012353 [Nyssa sinensis]